MVHARAVVGWGAGSDPDERDKGASVSIFHIDDLLSCRVCHLPAVTGFGSVIAGVVVRIGEGLRTWRPCVLFHGTQRIVMDELALLQFGSDLVIDALLQVRRLGCPQCRTFGFPFGTRAVLAEQRP